jgi:hypothetical protein
MEYVTKFWPSLKFWPGQRQGLWKYIDAELPYKASRPARLSPPRGAGWEPVSTLRSTRRAKKSHLVGAVGAAALASAPTE